MTPQNLIDKYQASDPTEKTIMTLLALHSEFFGKTKIVDCLRLANIKTDDGIFYSAAALTPDLDRLVGKGLIELGKDGGYGCPQALLWPVIRGALALKTFDTLSATIDEVCRYNNRHTYRSALGRLRIGLLRGEQMATLARWIEFSESCFHMESHPLIAICGAPFNPEMIERFHPEMQQVALVLFLRTIESIPESAQELIAFVESHQARPAREGSDGSLARLLDSALAEALLLCGRLDDAWKLCEKDEFGQTLCLRASTLLLRGQHADAVSVYDQAVKALRKEAGKRSYFIHGFSGYLFVLAMMRSEDPKMRKQGENYLDLATRGEVSSFGMAVYVDLSKMRLIQAGVLGIDAGLDLRGGKHAIQRMFHVLILYWLGLTQPDGEINQLLELAKGAESAGFHLITTQIGGLLARLGEPRYAERAMALSEQYGIDDLATWFARQEPWERQLSALINLQQGSGGAAAADKTAQSRLIWLISYDPKYGVGQIDPREQKRDARGNWTKGRAIALKRLNEGGDEMDFLTPQDQKVIAGIGISVNYYGGQQYEIDGDKAVAALIGHPLVFWSDPPNARVELLRTEPQLLIHEAAGTLKFQLEPNIADRPGNILITKETPTRLRVLQITDEHRRIAAIVGRGLSVPLQAKEKVLQAISAISTMVTVQSDIGGGAANVAQVEADQRLHIHLLPHQLGLRMQALVRPLPDGGPYYAPGQGAENVIAEIDGTPMQARRDLTRESRAERQLIAGCPVLEKAEQAHGEWLLDEPEDCLELLLELQEQPAESLLMAWPEGERFKVGARYGSKQFRMSIKGERDWFSAGGELQVDEQKVLDLRQLLELLKQSHGRFLKIGENEFLALTEEFHRRLSELAALGELHGKGVRVHALATFALEDLANSADGTDGADGAGGGKGGLKADKLWKQHLARLREVEAYAPQLPGTLQAELRDYQLAGFEWLARLAHWGVGACLADDMGLGKTLQALALILHRAPQGPTLVVAPTSVCMNWMGETARFAPTLNVVLFGGGDRKEALAALQPFDLVIVSYGLLQQEAEMFATVAWHTIVLDEAQAIKNAATKRSQAVMALNGGFRMVATGTPLENHLGELWNLFRFINPGLLGSLEQFNQRFAGPIERLVGPPGPQAQENRAEQSAARARLRRLIQPFILRRTKSQVLSELPSRTEILLQVDLSPEETALYQTLRRSALEHLAGLNPAAKGASGQQAIQILAEIMKLRRACCNPQLVAPELGLPSSKLAAFAELLDELLENKHKVLVFSQFVDHLSLIRAHLDQRAIRYQYLDGSTLMLDRKKRVDAFQGGDGDVFLISLKAGGMGINLTAADYVIHMDPWWNPAVEDQASDRAHRMGQTRPVTIYRLVARHTIEETIVDLHKHKRDLADSLLEGSDMAARLSTSEMMAMLKEGLR